MEIKIGRQGLEKGGCRVPKLTDFVFSFDGKLHDHLLGVGTDEDKWRPRLLAQIWILQKQIDREWG